jgi:uncharacterized protein (TIGR00369 family)
MTTPTPSGFTELVDLRVLATHDGEAQVELWASERHLNPHGSVHGGALATMLDVAMGAAVADAKQEAPVTVDMTITYLEPAEPGRLLADAKVRRAGSRITIVEAEVSQGGDDGSDRSFVAHAVATFTTLG